MLVRIQNYTLADIEDSIRFLLDRAAHSIEVRQLAIEIAHDKQDRISAIYDWVRQQVSYIPDPIGAGGEEIELFISPVRMVQDYGRGLRPGGDCDDSALFFTSLARSLGMPSNVVIADSVGQGLDHAFSQVYSDKLGWIDVDTTSEFPLGWVFPYKREIIVS